jgi:hypothetical protein
MFSKENINCRDTTRWSQKLKVFVYLCVSRYAWISISIGLCCHMCVKRSINAVTILNINLYIYLKKKYRQQPEVHCQVWVTENKSIVFYTDLHPHSLFLIQGL